MKSKTETECKIIVGFLFCSLKARLYFIHLKPVLAIHSCLKWLYLLPAMGPQMVCVTPLNRQCSPNTPDNDEAPTAYTIITVASAASKATT